MGPAANVNTCGRWRLVVQSLLPQEVMLTPNPTTEADTWAKDTRASNLVAYDARTYSPMAVTPYPEYNESLQTTSVSSFIPSIFQQVGH